MRNADGHSRRNENAQNFTAQMFITKPAYVFRVESEAHHPSIRKVHAEKTVEV